MFTARYDDGEVTFEEGNHSAEDGEVFAAVYHGERDGVLTGGHEYVVRVLAEGARGRNIAGLLTSAFADSEEAARRTAAELLRDRRE